MLLIQLVAVAILTLSAHYATPFFYLPHNSSGIPPFKTKHIVIALSVLILVTSIGVVTMHWLSEQSLLSFSLLRLSFSLYVTYLGCYSLVPMYSKSVTEYSCNITNWLLISLGISSFCVLDQNITFGYLIKISSTYIFIKLILLIFDQQIFKYKNTISLRRLKLTAGLSLSTVGAIALLRSLSILY